MENDATVLRGVVRGRTIELERTVNLPDGQEVRIIVSPAPAHGTGEGISRSFGGWADDQVDELDRFLGWNQERRKQGRREYGE